MDSELSRVGLKMLLVKRLLTMMSMSKPDKEDRARKRLEPNSDKALATLTVLSNTGRFNRPETLDLETCMSLQGPFMEWSQMHQDVITCRAHFVNLENVEYNIIRPPIVLFEKIVTSPRALRFFEALLQGQRKQTRDIAGQPRQRFFCSEQELSAETMRRVHKRLTETSKKFIVIFVEPNGKELVGDAVTFSLDQSRKACVTIAVSWHAIELALSCNSILELKKHYLRVALILAHEFAHTVQLVHNGDGPGDPFFQDDDFGELGFAFLNWTIGGDAGYQVPNSTGFVFKLAATNHMWKRYQRAGTPFPITKDLPQDEQWIVPDSKIEQLFTDKFWEVDMPATKGWALRMNPEAQDVTR